MQSMSCARAGTFYEMIRERTRSTSSPFLIYSLSRTFAPGRADFTVTDTERKTGEQEFVSANQLQKKCKKRQFLSTHDGFIRERFGSERPWSNGVALKKWFARWTNLRTRTTLHAKEEERNTYRSNWWIRSNFVGSDTMPTRHRPDFKEALSNLRRLKNAEDQAYYQNWLQSSSSSWCQWQDSWWHPHLRHHRDDGSHALRGSSSESRHVIHVHVCLSLSSPLSLSTSICRSPSSPTSSLSSISSSTLSSTTWSPCKTCAPPRTRE